MFLYLDANVWDPLLCLPYPDVFLPHIWVSLLGTLFLFCCHLDVTLLGCWSLETFSADAVICTVLQRVLTSGMLILCGCSPCVHWLWCRSSQPDPISLKLSKKQNPSEITHTGLDSFSYWIPVQPVKALLPGLLCCVGNTVEWGRRG